MVSEDKSINATVVNTYTNSPQSGNTRTDGEMSEDKINNNITNSIPSCTILDNDRHQENLVALCEGKPKQLDIGVELEDSKSKDDGEISGNSENGFAVIEEDSSNEYSNTIEDTQCKEYNDINEEECNNASDFVGFMKEYDKREDYSILFNMQLYLRFFAISLFWIIVKLVKIVTATIVSFLEMVVMKQVNKEDTRTSGIQQWRLLSLSDIRNPKEDYIHTKVNNAVHSKDSDDYIQHKEHSFVIIDIDYKEVVAEVQKEYDDSKSKHTSDKCPKKEYDINRRQSVVVAQWINADIDGKRVTDKVQRKVGDEVNAKVLLDYSLEENVIVGEKMVGDILAQRDDSNDEKAVVDIRGCNKFVLKRVDEIPDKVNDFHGEMEAAKVKVENFEIDGEKTEKEDENESEMTLKEICVCEIQEKNADIGDFKADDKMIRNDDFLTSRWTTSEYVEKDKETVGKSQLQNNDLDSENVEENYDSKRKTAVGKILESGVDVDGKEAACCNSVKNEKCGIIGENNINTIQETEKKQDIILREQTENVDGKKIFGSRIEDTETVTEIGETNNLRDTKVFVEQDNKEDNISTRNAVCEIQETTSYNINATQANRDSFDHSKATVIQKFQNDLHFTNKHIKMPSLNSNCPKGKSFDEIEQSHPKTVHAKRDWNNFETVILLLLVFAIPCTNGQLATEVKWSLHTKPVIFGSNATLCCIMQSPATNHIAWVRDPDAIVVATGDSPSNRTKYSASVELRGNLTYYWLTIINVDMTDVNVNYKCESGFVFLEKKLEMREDSFVMKPSSKETATNITRENGIIFFSIRILNLYPRPQCFVLSKKENITGNVSSEENRELFNVQMTFGISEDMCENNIIVYCVLGKETAFIDLPSSNNSWTKRCTIDRHVGNAVLIVTVIISFALVFICIITVWLLKNYLCRKLKHAVPTVFV